MKSSIIFLFSFLRFLHLTQSANILFISAVPSPSHHIFNRVLAVGLVEKGHNVTFLSADLSKTEVKNLTYVYLSGIYEFMDDTGATPEQWIEESDQLPMIGIKTLYEMCSGLAESTLKSPGLGQILNYPKEFKFDSIIYDFTAGPYLIPLVTRFNNPPLIALTAFVNPPYTTDYVGGHKYPAYIPHYNVNYGTNMNFFQRLHNTFLYFFDWLCREYYMFIKIDPIIKSRFEFEVPSLREITEKTAITLVNTDCAIEAPEPLPPNIIPVGGLQITDPKPLSEKMEKFVKAGKKGTILMSLGTNLKSSLLGADKLKIIMETFKTFPEYNFLWKFEADEKDLPMKKPSNLMIEKFLPQNDILAHSSVKAFITHSGMLSTHEAFYNGVPIIGIPFIADQHSNAQKAINIGVGIKIDFTKLSVETFKSAINEVLTNPKYAKNADKISRLFRDKPSRPLQSAIWWIEFAMRNPNLENMKSPSLKLGFFAANSYDVIIFVVVIFILIKRLITKIFIKIFNLKDNPKQKRE